MYATMHKRVRNAVSSRRNFLKGSAVAAGALVIGTTVDFGKARAASAAGRPEPECLREDRQGQHRHGDDQAPRHGAGQLRPALATIVADELDADWSQVRDRIRARERAALQQPVLRPVQGTGGSTAVANSWVQLRNAARRARDAGSGRGGPVEGAGCRDHRLARRRGACRQADHLRRPRHQGGNASRPHAGQAEGAEGLGLHRQARAAPRLDREDHRQGDLRARHPPPRHAHRGHRALAAFRRHRASRSTRAPRRPSRVWSTWCRSRSA